MNDWHTTNDPTTATDVADDAERRARLESLDRDVQRLEHERLWARSTPARLVALDVELCRVEAARRMLVPAAPNEPEA